MPEAVIESGIPSSPRGFVRQYGILISASETLAKLEAGQSFVVDDNKSRAIVYGYAARRGIAINSKKDGIRIRIWRTK